LAKWNTGTVSVTARGIGHSSPSTSNRSHPVLSCTPDGVRVLDTYFSIRSTKYRFSRV
jgi:hypothetical protein